ncbi:MAG: hypothetical protein JWM86_1266 [Thermoleophilia bacterium]|nr:hypothetical protein [Thermoleophilia bacterium]
MSELVKGPWTHRTRGTGGLAAGSGPSYHGCIAGPHQALGKAPRRHIMKARLFTLAATVASLAVVMGGVRIKF